MIFSSLIDFLLEEQIKFNLNFDTSKLVSIKIGGCCKVVVFPNTTEKLIKIITLIKDQKNVIIGNGTNCFFTDDSYDGVVVVTKNIDNIDVRGTSITAQCGASLNKICGAALKNSLSGLEFASGIPGSLGGAVYMNASAFGSDISSVIESSTILDLDTCEISKISNQEHTFGIKNSVFRNKKYVHLDSTICLASDESNSISQRMNKYMEHRKNTQPLDCYSAGSVFIKPKEGYAAQMIEAVGLKGYSIGGAQISKKHAGFIINVDNAKANDVFELIKVSKERVFKKFGVELKEEIIFIK